MIYLSNHLSDFIPDSIEDEASKNENDDYCMTEIHETTFNLRLKSDRICHDPLPAGNVSGVPGVEVPGVDVQGVEVQGVFPSAKLNFSEQKKQVILGLREDSVKAFWVQKDLNKRTLIENRNGLRQPEYVNIHTTDDTVEIKFMFDYPDEAVSHFEFTFQLRI